MQQIRYVANKVTWKREAASSAAFEEGCSDASGRLRSERELRSLAWRSDGYVVDRQVADGRREKRKMEALLTRLEGPPSEPANVSADVNVAVAVSAKRLRRERNAAQTSRVSDFDSGESSGDERADDHHHQEAALSQARRKAPCNRRQAEQNSERRAGVRERYPKDDQKQAEQRGARLASTVYEAVKSGDQRAVALALHKAAAEPVAQVLNSLNLDGYSPLHRAAMNGTVRIVRQLLQHGALCNLSSRVGTTPLDEAVRRGSADCVRVLVLAGARDFHWDVRERERDPTQVKQQNVALLARRLLAIAAEVGNGNGTQLEVLRRMLLATPVRNGQCDCSATFGKETKLQFSDAPFDDVVLFRKKALCERLFVLMDHVQRCVALHASCMQPVATASLLKQFELVAPTFDVLWAQQVRELLAQRACDLGTADELTDEDIAVANVLEHDDQLLALLGIRSRSVFPDRLKPLLRHCKV